MLNLKKNKIMCCVLTNGQILDCQNLPVGGVSDKLFIYNREDFLKVKDNLVFDAGTGSITSITNPTGIQAYSFDVPPNSAKFPGEIVAVEGGFKTYNHSANFPIIKNKQLAKNQAMAMALSKVVVIYWKNSGEGELLGLEQGLSVVTNGYDPSNIDTGGTIPLELKTEGARESKMPISIDDGVSSASTLAMIEALTAVGV